MIGDAQSTATSENYQKIYYFHQLIKLLYMTSNSSFWLLRVESRDFSQAEEERVAWKSEQIHKMTTFFTQNGLLGRRFSF